MMTRKTFETAARAIASARIGDTYDPAATDPAEMEGEQYGRQAACNEIAQAMADMFAADNPRFDREKFLAATRKDDRE